MINVYVNEVKSIWFVIKNNIVSRNFVSVYIDSPINYDSVGVS